MHCKMEKDSWWKIPVFPVKPNEKEYIFQPNFQKEAFSSFSSYSSFSSTLDTLLKFMHSKVGEMHQKDNFG